MSETNDNTITQELLKEKLRGVTRSWRADDTFAADSTARQYGYFPVDMGANIRALETRIETLLHEFHTATKCKVSGILVRRYNYANPKDDTLSIEVNVEK
jgi:hypothetical protein